MIGTVSIFHDRRLPFWLSAVYATKELLLGGYEEDVAHGATAVWDCLMDEIDIEESIEYWKQN